MLVMAWDVDGRLAFSFFLPLHFFSSLSYDTLFAMRLEKHNILRLF